jgi:type I restriction enzyme S subunit
MSAESLFVLSVPWEVIPLGDVCRRGGGNVQTGPFGSQLHASDYVPDGIPSIMPMNIGDNRINEKGIARITPEDAQRLSKYLVKIGDIVYSRRGDVERRSLIRNHENGWLCGTGCLRVSFGEKNVVHPPYAAYYLGHPLVREWIVRHAQGATMPNLNTSILSALPFVLPPFEEQERIAGILADLDDKIELNRQINQTLEQIAHTIFKSWFVDFEPVKAKIKAKAAGRDPEHAAMCAISGKLETELDQLPPEQYQKLAATAALFPDELVESELGLIPVGWNCRKLEDFVVVVDYVANGSFASLKENVQLQNSPGYALFVRTTDFNSGFSGDFRFVSKAAYEFLKKSSLDGSEIIISNVGDVGTVFRAPKWLGYPMTLGSNAVALKSKIANSFLFHYFKGHEGQFAIQSIVTGSAQLKFNKTNLRGLDIVVPSDSLLNHFSGISNSIQNQQDNLEGQTRSLAALRDTLLPELLSGIINFS